MTIPTHLHFPCPSCGEQLTFPENSAGSKTECPHCYAMITIPIPQSHAASEIAEDSPFDGPHQTGGFLSFVCFFFCILTPFFCLLFAFMSSLAVFLPNPWGGSVTGGHVGDAVLHAIQAVVFLLWGVHSFRVGYRLWRMQPLAVHKARRLLYLSAVYGIVELVIFVLIIGAPAELRVSPGETVFFFVFGLAWLLTPLMLLLLYFHNSKRVRTTFSDEFPSAPAQS